MAALTLPLMVDHLRAGVHSMANCIGRINYSEPPRGKVTISEPSGATEISALGPVPQPCPKLPDHDQKTIHAQDRKEGLCGQLT